MSDATAGSGATATDEPSPALAEPAAAAVDLAGIERDLAAVEGALARLDDGTYGSCDVCREAIADELLAADPTTRRCADHPA